MSSETPKSTASKVMFWTGVVFTVLICGLFLFSAAAKFQDSPEFTTELERLGWSNSLIRSIAVVEIVCAVLFVIPQTSMLGAVLLTGYMGGAIATHVRIGDGFAAQTIFGVLVWLALFLRDERLRRLLPWRFRQTNPQS